ncbi:MAG: peptidoglycan DD-metalloendopeptidase family protein [Alphaproteobacteria bacterium]
MTKKLLILLMVPFFLWGCETLPFRWGADLDVQDIVSKDNKITKLQKAKPDKQVAEGRLYKTKLVRKKIIYKVRKGDSLYALARKHKIKISTLARDNKLKSNAKLKIGQRLVINKKVLKKVPIKTTKNNDGITPPKNQTKVTKTAISNSRQFLWPLNPANLTQKFGRGISQDGIILSGTLGQNVLATNNGSVIYVGTDIKPLGLLVLIKHNNGFVSTYGHLQGALVKKGDTVKTGKAIATLGQSGKAQQPQLYFEIRKNNKPTNPLKFLGDR